MIPPVIVLDTGPLSNCVMPLAKPNETPTLSQQCRQWLQDCEVAGATLMVPAISYYEVLRELERRKATAKIARRKAFSFLVPDRFVPLATIHLERAAQLWGAVRNAGIQTAANDALDGDVILAAQALTLGLPASDYVIATTNTKHISLYAPCSFWTNITP